MLFMRNNNDMRNIVQERNKIKTKMHINQQMIDRQDDVLKKYEEEMLFHEYAKTLANVAEKNNNKQNQIKNKLKEDNASYIRRQIV